MALADRRSVLQVVAERGAVAPGAEARFLLLLTDPVGQPRAGEVQVSGAASGAVQLDSAGLGTFTLKVGACASQLLRLTFRHGGQAVPAQVRCLGSWQLLTLDLPRALYAEGQRARVTVRAPASVPRVTLEVLRSNSSALTRVVPLRDGRGSTELQLTAELGGTLILRAHAPAAQGVLQDQRMIYVRTADALTVQVKTDRASYRPGETARVTLRLADSAGRPAPGAMGVNVVDEALYALTDFKPGLERSYFLLQDEVIDASKALSFVSPQVVLQASPTAADQARARMLFAAAGQDAAYPIHDASGDADLDTAVAASRAGVQALVTRLERDYREQWGARRLPHEEAAASWARALVDGRPDDFGVPYLHTHQAPYLTLRSAGMDETWGTADDLGATAYLPVAVKGKGALPAGGGHDGGVTRDAAAWGYPDAGSLPAADMAAAADSGAAAAEAGAGGVQIRQDFPETLYVNPALITDRQGEAVIDLPLADSVTTWRLTAIAHTTAGQLGSAMAGVTAFQEFFLDSLLPESLLQGDRVDVPVAVYNYTASAQEVTVTVKPEAWFSLLSDASQTVSVPARSVASARFRLRADLVGEFGLTATGVSATDADGLRRQVRVLPDGVRQELVTPGTLQPGTAAHTVRIPQQAIDGASALLVKVFPGVLAEVTEGLESIFHEPYGCFEQTSSATYPNVMVLRYLRQAGTSSPQVEKQALGYIDTGYQRLLSFEVGASGGFSLFGDAPARTWLTAFGLMEFADMAKVRYVDPALIARVQTFLAAQQRPDGSYAPDTCPCYDDQSLTSSDPLFTTAYVAWALQHSGYSGLALSGALAYVRAHADQEADPYVQAVVANTLLEADANDAVARRLLDKLKRSASVSGEAASWTSYGCSPFYGYGASKTVETTALATAALMLAKEGGPLPAQGLAYLSAARSGSSGWGTTQATFQALRALILSLDARGTAQVDGKLQVWHQGALAGSATVTPATSDVVRLFDLSAAVVEGDNKVELSFTGAGALAYQVVGVYHLPHGEVAETGPLRLHVAYDRTSLQVGESVRVTVRVANAGPGTVPAVMAKVGLPPGFEVDLAALTADPENGAVRAAEQEGPFVVLYLEDLRRHQLARLQMKASLPVQAKAPPSQAYPYYTPEHLRVVQTPAVSVAP